MAHSSTTSSSVGSLNIVISGPGGVGKGTIVAALMAVDDRLWLSQSWSTRDRRTGEPAEAYNFVSREQFDAHISNGGFLEWVDFLDYRQGTPVPECPPGFDVVFEIDVFGGVAIAERFNDPLLLFVDTPSRGEQRRRLEGRGDPPDKVAARIQRGDLERDIALEHGYQTVINDDLDTTVGQLLAIIETARAGH